MRLLLCCFAALSIVVKLHICCYYVLTSQQITSSFFKIKLNSHKPNSNGFSYIELYTFALPCDIPSVVMRCISIFYILHKLLAIFLKSKLFRKISQNQSQLSSQMSLYRYLYVRSGMILPSSHIYTHIYYLRLRNLHFLFFDFNTIRLLVGLIPIIDWFHGKCET